MVEQTGTMFVLGRARIQFLGDGILRLEWSGDRRFEDRPSLAVFERNLHSKQVEYEKNGIDHRLTTGEFSIDYSDNGKPLGRKNCRIKIFLGGETVEWWPGKRDEKNLKGTLRTLDALAAKQWQLDDGLLSRNGWSCYDDSTIPLLERKKGVTSRIVPRSLGVQDLYLFFYGNEFKRILKEATRLFGAQPLPPLFAFGYWWSRYWPYTDGDFEKLVDDFDERGLPIDVLAIDMDWHQPGWTGYTWDKRYFVDPSTFISQMKQRGLHLTMNLHPAAGVSRDEEYFPELCADLDLDPEQGETVPFCCTDPRFVMSYFKWMHRPHERLGIDFWWLDWQQGDRCEVPGIVPLPWLNHLFWEDRRRHNGRKRPLLMSRYGGLGAGRYPVGFSGDTYTSWETLAAMPWFTSTAANVLYGYWSHDIGGHDPGDPSPELMTRWIQFGTYSPIMRTHASKNPNAERRPWAFPEPYAAAIRAALKCRYELVPYIYTESRKSFDSGISLCRPLYHEFPEEEAAFLHDDQYFFGDTMVLAPILQPSDHFGLSKRTIYLPPGRWFERSTGQLLEGGQNIERTFLLDEVPTLIRSGTPIPLFDGVLRLGRQARTNIHVLVIPGESGSYELYEDDGQSEAYLEGDFCHISLTHEWADNRSTLLIDPPPLAPPWFIKRRMVRVTFVAIDPPKRVSVDGTELSLGPMMKSPYWIYNGAEGALEIFLGRSEWNRTIRIDLDRKGRSTLTDGWSGLFRRLDLIRRHVDNALEYYLQHDQERLAVDLWQCANRISRMPERIDDERRFLEKSLVRLPLVLTEIRDKHKKKHKKVHLDRALAVFDTLEPFLGSLGLGNR